MKKIRLLGIILITVFIALLIPCIVLPLVTAEGDNGTLYVHFYNGEGEYEYSHWGDKDNVSWGAYYWIDVGRIVPATDIDPDFYREDNVGQYFTIKLNATETSAVRGGKKLGLIMVRAYVDETNTFCPYWYGNKGKDLPADRFVTVNLDENNEAHLWIIAGDKNNYTSLEQAKTAFERIEAARFDDFNKIDVQTTSTITTDTGYSIYAVKDAINGADEKGELVAQGKLSEANDKTGTISCNLQNFDWHTDYMLYMDGYAFPAGINKTRLYLSPRFKSECIPTDADKNGEVDTEFGVFYTQNQSVFRFWGPISTNVVVNFYKTGNETDPTLYRANVEMTKGAKGVWEATVQGDLNNVYYTYTNYVGGEVIELCDPYATATGINGNRAMVCDLDATDPDNWNGDLATATEIRNSNSQVPVIWEIHVRDFSISPESGLTYKGKYLAFTEEDTTAKGDDTLKTGISYLKDLGINYVHLNPVYDFATVDEEYNNNVDYAAAQNWGYDPKNYNVPEGSYSTDAENGATRINEFKQMVQALHEAGIGVIMDVVYNHTYTSNSCFDQAVPGYYYRQSFKNWKQGNNGTWYPVLDGSFNQPSWALTALGAYELSDASGCSNETASEREMYRSYIINSVTYWAEEYHIDGFRFDLMGIHDTQTMNDIRTALNTLPGGEGILIYGEPWAAAGTALDPRVHTQADYAGLSKLKPGIKVFNSTIREAIKGNNSPGAGFVNGNFGMVNNLIIGLTGGISGGGTCNTNQSINYTTSHDNYTLWDQLVKTTITNATPTDFVKGNILVEKRNMMAASMVLLGGGTSFILAGEEMGRTKFGNHNSYNAQDKINAFDYYRQAEFSNLYNWYKGLIAFRTKYFTTLGREDMASKFFTSTYANNSAMFGFGCDRINATDKYSKFMVLCNAGGSNYSLSYDAGWYLIANSNTGVIDLDGGVSLGNTTFTVPAYTTLILVQK